jgi:hypothetical protein
LGGSFSSFKERSPCPAHLLSIDLANLMNRRIIGLLKNIIETLGQIYDEPFARQYSFLRPYVQQVIYRYLDCGILDNGFARARCGECGRRMRIIAFIEDTVN